MLKPMFGMNNVPRFRNSARMSFNKDLILVINIEEVAHE